MNQLNNFLDFDRQKNGTVKIERTVSQEANIYKLLSGAGFHKTKLDGKRRYYRRTEKGIEVSNKLDFSTFFLDFLKECDLSNVPQEIRRSDIIEWFAKTGAVKENDLFDLYLTEELTDEEKHQFRLLTNHSYRHRFEIDQLLKEFDNWDLLKAKDEIGSFGKDNPLFFKEIEKNKYLVFNHFNSSKPQSDFFDCWIAQYSRKPKVGQTKPVSIDDIRLGFKLDRDYHLIERYL